MYAADGNQVTANAVQEYTIPPEEGIEGHEAPATDIQTVNISKNVMRILPIGSRDTMNRTRVPVSRIFDRLRNIPWNSVESNYMTHTGVLACSDNNYLMIQDGDLETISLGILYTSFMVSSLFASSVVTKLGSKNALLLGTTGYLPDLLIMFAAKGFDSRLQLNVRELDFRGTLLDFIHTSIASLIYLYLKGEYTS
ncbi:UNC93-like protein 3 [Tanacetum coccineum]